MEEYRKYIIDFDRVNELSIPVGKGFNGDIIPLSKRILQSYLEYWDKYVINYPNSGRVDDDKISYIIENI